MPEQQDTRSDRISLTAVLVDTAAAAAFDRWVVPEQLTQWWPPIAEVDPMQGGSYHFFWPAQNWHLRGRFAEFQPGNRLTYTWRWDHDPHDAETIVDAHFDALPTGGTALTVTHGPYPDTEAGRERRQEHLDGWMYFLGRLEALG